MRLAVLSDVHGNRHALEAVLADGAREGVDAWWAIGDLVAVGPDPVATLEVLAGAPNLVVSRGNSERYVTTGDRPAPHPDEVAADPSLLPLFAAVEGSFAWTRGALSSTPWLAWLEDLPLEIRTELPDGTRLLGVHATPGRDDGDGITPERSEDELRADLAGADADIVVAGHTHQPTDRWIDGVRLLNGGSLSNPVTDDLRPSYTIIHADADGHRVEHRRVDYDRGAFMQRLRRSGHPQHEFIAAFQRGDMIRHPSRRPGAPTCDA